MDHVSPRFTNTHTHTHTHAHTHARARARARAILIALSSTVRACAVATQMPTEAGYAERLEATVSSFVLAARNHPSVVLWCGGNEFIASRSMPQVIIIFIIFVAKGGGVVVFCRGRRWMNCRRR